MILTCNNISKTFDTKTILDKVSFHITSNEKVAVVGANGSGKSTLFKIIMDEISADHGEVVLAKDKTIGYLAQHHDLISENTIYDEVLTVKQYLIDLYEQIRTIEKEMKNLQGEALDRMLKNYSRLVHEYESNNGYAYKSEVVGILKGLGFSEEDFTKKISTLSGGERTRISLGKLLLSTPDIILLDEPTNNLDLVSINWLEIFLQNYPGAVIVIAHDRYFLDKLVTKVIEIENTKGVIFIGSYSDYAHQKAMRDNAMLKQYLNQQSKIKHQEEVISKLRSFNREKSIRRAESREKLLDKMEVIERPKVDHTTMNLSLKPRITSGKDVLNVEGLSMSFDHNPLFDNINFEIKRGEKIALIGNNGTGKTTILKIINQQLKANKGQVNLGSKVKIGYYDQNHEILNEKKTLFDELHDSYPSLDNTAIRSVLAAFLFTGEDVFKLVGELSGGERGRVSLAKLMLSEANLLILDEPTNHLDIHSKEILENALNHYEGTILYVSHDRYFINKTATRILDLTNKNMINYIGDYDYYIEKKPELEATYLGITQDLELPSHISGLKGLQTESKVNMVNTSNPNESEASQNKLSWQQRKEEQALRRRQERELEETEDKINQLEIRNEEIDSLLSLEEVYSDVEKLIELNKEKEEIENTLEELMDRWSRLASI